MPAKRNADLHGNVPERAEAALLLIDVINDFEFEGGEQLLKHAEPMAERLAVLKRRAKRIGIPAIYVNDNFGRWQSNFTTLLARCREADSRGRSIVHLLAPDEDDYFVLKPKHSGFFSTTLDTLLQYLQASTLIITGIAGDNCVLFTAGDAFMRDFHLFVPADCVVSIEAEDNAHALAHMARVLHADTTASTDLDVSALVSRGSSRSK